MTIIKYSKKLMVITWKEEIEWRQFLPILVKFLKWSAHQKAGFRLQHLIHVSSQVSWKKLLNAIRGHLCPLMRGIWQPRNDARDWLTADLSKIISLSNHIYTHIALEFQKHKYMPNSNLWMKVCTNSHLHCWQEPNCRSSFLSLQYRTAECWTTNAFTWSTWSWKTHTNPC